MRLFVSKLLQFMRDGAAGLKPTHLAIVLDKSEGSFRKELYEDYKGHRPDAPEDLKVQMPIMREAIRAFGLEPVELQRYEADDLIATYTQQAKARGADVLIISSDKDLMQLVGPKVCFYDFESGSKGKPGYRPERNLDEAAVTEKWEGIPPEKIGDVLALMGDTSDNVPGVPGIGLKTAAQLIKEFGDLETLLERAPEIKQPKRRETLIANAESARLSKKLVTLDCEAPVPVPLDDLRLPEPDPKTLIGFLKAMEFNTLTRRVAGTLRCRSHRHRARSAPPARRRGDPLGARRRGNGHHRPHRRCGAVLRQGRCGLGRGRSLRRPRPAGDRRPAQAGRGSRHALAACGQARDRGLLGARRRQRLRDRDQPRAPEGMGGCGARAGLCRRRHGDERPRCDLADLVGFSLALEPGKACYVPLQHRGRIRSLRRRAREGPDPHRRGARRHPSAVGGCVRSSRSARTSNTTGSC